MNPPPTVEKDALRDRVAEALIDYLAHYTLPANYSRPISGSETHADVARRCGPLLADHLMPLLTGVTSPDALDDCGHHPEWSSKNGCRHPNCVTSPGVCPTCGHAPHAPGLCEADQQPACDCNQDDTPLTHRVRCSRCGAPCSNPLPVEVIVRAFVECPECVQEGS